MKTASYFFTALMARTNAFAFITKKYHVTTKTSLYDASISETKSVGLEALEELAPKLNPIIPFWDPLTLVDGDFYNMGQDATIGFLRHAELKHGRVAMAAFVGYCVQSNWHWPWAMMRDGTGFPSIDLSPEDQWDAIPVEAKWQIATVIAAMEIWDEGSGWDGTTPHYTKGRQPGKYPSYQTFRNNIHFVLDLYDPFRLNKNMSAEKKERRLVAEINNGRLAMIGILGFLAADKVEGSVPFLSNYAQPYGGQVMAPFENQLNVFDNFVGTFTSVVALGIIFGSQFRKNNDEVELMGDVESDEPVVVMETATSTIDESPIVDEFPSDDAGESTDENESHTEEADASSPSADNS